jgi:hypothetical protein
MICTEASNDLFECLKLEGCRIVKARSIARLGLSLAGDKNLIATCGHFAAAAAETAGFNELRRQKYISAYLQ